MSLFRYDAVAPSGALVSGEIDAISQEAVIDHLHAQGCVPIRADHAGPGVRTFPWLRLRRAGKASGGSVDLDFITEQLASLLHAGLPLDRALEFCADIASRGASRESVLALLEGVRGGGSLADAMAADERAFPRFYVGMVRAGEAGGSLEASLRHLADLLARSRAAREQVKSALIYPCVVLGTGAASVALLFGFVIPHFRPLFDAAETSLPLTTRVILAMSDGLRDDWWMLSAIIGALALAAYRYAVTPDGRRLRDSLLLRLPIVGELVTKIEIARFGRTLGTLMRNGVSPLAALSITQETVSNAVLREDLASVVESVRQGHGFAEPLAQAPRVPALAAKLARVGEETARLDDMLLKIAEIFESDTRRSIERLLALLVPAITIGLGVIVALVIGSILSAVLSVYNLAV